MRDRDTNIAILEKVIQYADEISGTISRFELDLVKFKSDYVVKNAIAMSTLQIGELAGKLTDEFRSKYSKMPWKSIVGLRNIAAHAYGSVDMEILWGIATVNVPELKAYCQSIVKDKESV
jgi:uncharacterized protein with HEPN domain